MFSAVVVTPLLLWAGWRLLTAGHRLRGTTLRLAWAWSLAALVLWFVGWTGQTVSGAAPPAWLNLTWYVAAVVSLCPWVAVLGAKRPGVRVWTWFVLLPLILVLTLPVMAGVGPSWSNAAVVRIPLPLVLGFALVLLMGVGNYMGTRYALAAAVAAVALCLVTAPHSDAAPQWLSASPSTSAWATGLLSVSILLAHRQSLRPTVARSPIERLWFDYRDAFGIVWARRLLERVNDRARTEGWDCRLADEGFIPVVDHASPSIADPRIEHTFRWLLRRFVDPEWIDRRLAATRNTHPADDPGTD
jgi:hypothetical protein